MAQAAIPLISSLGSAAIGKSSQESALSDEMARREHFAELMRTMPEGMDPEDVFGRKPVFKDVPYKSLSTSDPGFKKHVADLLKANLSNVPGAQKLFEKISAGITNVMKNRAKMFDPNFLSTLSQLGSNAALASRGRLPMEDARGIVANQAEFGSLLGTPGGRRPQIARDLGMTRNMLATQVGPGLLNQVQGIFNAVDPLQAHVAVSPGNYMLNPSQTLPIGVQENQWGTQYQRGQEDQRMWINAMPDPAIAGLFNMDRQALGYLAAPYANAMPSASAGGGGGMGQAFFGALPQAFQGFQQWQQGRSAPQSVTPAGPVATHHLLPQSVTPAGNGGPFANLINGGWPAFA